MILRRRTPGSSVPGALMLLAASLLAGCSGELEPSVAPEPTSTASPTTPDPVVVPSPSQTAETGPVLRNGRITSAERYLGVNASGYDWRSFDPASQTGLFLVRGGRGDLKGFTVFGPDGPVAKLTCARDVRCSPKGPLAYDAGTLGPGADEVTVSSGGRGAQVVGHDGTLRQVLDLGATTTGGGEVRGLRWSPDGSKLAVVTFQVRPGGATVSRVWLVDPGGGEARLAYSLLFDRTNRPSDARDFDGKGVLWVSSGWGWSPDGQTLLLDVRTEGSPASDVVVLRLQPDEPGDPVIPQTLYNSDRHFDRAGNVAW